MLTRSANVRAVGGDRMGDARVGGVVRRARGGDSEALAELYREFSRRVFGLCRHLLGSTEATEDATSEVFVRMQRALKSYDSALPFPRWLLSIASHCCVDQLRRQRVERRLFRAEDFEGLEPAESTASALSELLGEEQRATVRAALGALPERYRLPLVLRYYSEMSYEQIAGALGLTRGHVATLIFRAKQDLRRRLGPASKELLQ